MAGGLPALRLAVLSEVVALPGGVARLADRLRLHAELGLDDRAQDEASARRSAAQDLPLILI